MKFSIILNSFIFIFAVIYLLIISSCSAHTVESTDKEKLEDLPVLEYCDLRNNPDKYDEKTVRLKAEIRVGNHGEYLYDERCPADASIKTYYDATAAIIYKNKADEEKIRDIRDKRIENENSRKLWTDPVNVTAVGIFRKNNPTERDSGYERNAAFHFVINSIESFDKE